jgi:crossover junction endodeoxyribonuclease RuvC
MRILGIDPGSVATGFGVVERVEGRVVHRAHGTLRPRRGAPLAERVAALWRGVSEVIATHEPDVAAVEQVFVSSSPRSALVLGQARGAVLAALGEAGLRVHEYGARTVKMALTGAGAADKAQMQRMVRSALSLQATPGSDAADALAVAICHAQAGRLADLGVATGRRGGRGGRRGKDASWVVRRGR